VTARPPEPLSAGVLLDALLAERQVRLESIDAMTNKAGVMLGFTGGRCCAHRAFGTLAVAAARVPASRPHVRHSLAAMKVELLPGLSAAGMREKLLMRQTADAQLAIYDYFTFRHNAMVDVLTAKADRVDKAARWLGATIGVLAVAGLLDGVM
jgi:hypothetical protein